MSHTESVGPVILIDDRDHEIGALRKLARGQAAEVARLTKALDEREADMHSRIRAGYDKTVADSWRAEVAKRDAEIARLAAELGEVSRDRNAALTVLRGPAGENYTSCERAAEAVVAELARASDAGAQAAAELAAALAVPADVEAAIGDLRHEIRCQSVDEDTGAASASGAEAERIAVDRLRAAIARAIETAATPPPTVGGLLATAPKPQCPTHGDTVNCYCATGALHCHDCGYTPPFCTDCDGYHDTGACSLPKGG